MKRMIWEIYHINAGRLALVLALINISLGVFLAVVPYTAWLIWFVMFALWVAVLIVMEVRLQYKRYKSGGNKMMEMRDK
jgi:membrane protein implicated in regulation of membrane protease activity